MKKSTLIALFPIQFAVGEIEHAFPILDGTKKVGEISVDEPYARYVRTTYGKLDYADRYRYL